MSHLRLLLLRWLERAMIGLMSGIWVVPSSVAAPSTSLSFQTSELFLVAQTLPTEAPAPITVTGQLDQNSPQISDGSCEFRKLWALVRFW